MRRNKASGSDSGQYAWQQKHLKGKLTGESEEWAEEVAQEPVAVKKPGKRPEENISCVDHFVCCRDNTATKATQGNKG